MLHDRLTRCTVPWPVLLTLLIAIVSTPSAAAGQELTGTLYGTVMADDGSVLPGVTVTISSPQLLKGSEVVVTNETGAFRVPALPPGTYSAKAELQGFQTFTRDNIVLQAGLALAVDFRLKVGGVSENVSVVGTSPLVDVQSSQAQRVIDNALIENVPTSRRFSDIIIRAPGVIDSGYSFAPAQIVLGSSPRDNLYTVDGASANDTTVGYMFLDIPYDMLEQTQVTSGGISAEFGQASGAVFNFITKSGGNTFSGGANYYLQNNTLSGNNLTDSLRAQGLTVGSKPIQNLDRGALLGGPILKNKIWFFGNARWLHSETSRPDFPVKNPVVDDRQMFVKLTGQVTPRTQIQGGIVTRRSDTNPSNPGVTTVGDPRTWQEAIAHRTIYSFGGNQTINSTTFVDVRWAKSKGPAETNFASTVPGYTDTATGLLSGGQAAPYQHVTARDDRNLKFNVTHFEDDFLGGSHNLKAGGEFEVAPLNIEYTVPGDFTQQLRSAVPFRVRLYNSPISERAEVARNVAFVQDGWTVAKRFTANVGVRIEQSHGNLPAQQGGGGNFAPTVTQFPEQTIIKWLTASPRLGFSWDVRGDQSTSLKGSYARYRTGLINQYVAYANPNSPSYKEYDWNDLNHDLMFEPGEQGTLRANSLSNLNFADPNLKQPYTDAWQIELDRQVGAHFALSVSGIYKRDRQMVDTVNVGLPFADYVPLTVTNPLNGQAMTIYALNPAFQGVQSVSMLTNPPGLERNFWGIQFAARRRLQNRWQLETSLDVGRSKGNLGNSFGQSVGNTRTYQTPNGLINAYGPLEGDAPVQVKVLGTYIAPGAVALSVNYLGVSGFPQVIQADFPVDYGGSTTVRFTNRDNPGIVVEPFVPVSVQPRGTLRFGFRNLLAARAEKKFRVAGHYEFGLVADAFNLLNTSTVLFVQNMTYAQPGYQVPGAIEQPRSLRLGVRFNF
jgi:Carboxypeptidase regulatory-like domain/TonB-dependent Receptor Plug Domain